jgi:hypothetical protein
MGGVGNGYGKDVVTRWSVWQLSGCAWRGLGLLFVLCVEFLCTAQLVVMEFSSVDLPTWK